MEQKHMWVVLPRTYGGLPRKPMLAQCRPDKSSHRGVKSSLSLYLEVPSFAMKVWGPPKGFPTQTPGLSRAHVGRPLSNRKIHQYALEGFYGLAAQQVAQVKDRRSRALVAERHAYEKKVSLVIKDLLS